MKKLIIFFLTLMIWGTLAQASTDEEAGESEFKMSPQVSSDEEESEPEVKLSVFAMTLLKVAEDSSELDGHVARIIQEKQPDVVKLRGYHPRLLHVLQQIKSEGYGNEAIQQSSLCRGVITNTSLVLFRDDLGQRDMQIIGTALQLTKRSVKDGQVEKVVVAFENGTIGSMTFEPIELMYLKQWADASYPITTDKGKVTPSVRIFTGLFDLAAREKDLGADGSLHVATGVVSHEYRPLHFANFWPEGISRLGWVHDHVFFTARDYEARSSIYPLKDWSFPQNCPIITVFYF